MRRHAALAVLLLATTPAFAAAQLGGLIKRGAERAVEKAADKQVERKVSQRPAPAFDAEVLELTAPRLDQVVRGLKAYNEARSRADVPGAIRAYEAAQQRERTLAERHGEQRQQWRERNDRIESCRRDAFSEQDARNQAEIERKMEAMRGDPARMQAMTMKAAQWAPKLQQLMQKGDTVGYRDGMIQMQRELATIAGVQLVADTAKVDASCGKPAPRPDWLVQWDSVEVQERRAAERVRTAESAGMAEAAQASGLTERQFAIARERIESFVKDGGMGFSRAERDLMTPRMAELRGYFPAE